MIRYILVPVVGAVIGYATNWIAVKMLFRPHHEIIILGFRLPFTPGVIPKGQGRLARAVGRAVEEQLLTADVLERVLLADEMKEKLSRSVDKWVMNQESSEEKIGDLLPAILSREKADMVEVSLKQHITSVIYEKLLSVNVGNIVSQKVLEAAKEKLAESMFGMMIGGSMLEPIADMVEVKINEYVADHGEEYINDMIEKETEELKGRTTGEFVALPARYDIDLPALVVREYEKIIKAKLPMLVSVLNFSGIVEDRINAMKVEEVEELLLSIMKKELGAIVNLGALIGFILGLINVAILLI